VYRGVASLVGGIIVALFCLAGVLDLLIESGTQDLLGAAVLLLVAALAAAYGIYPAAFADAERFTVRNPFRTIVLPWSTVTDLSARLSFVAQTEQARYTVWAIPVSMHDRRKAERERLKELSRANPRSGGRGRQRGLPDMPLPTGGRVDPIERLAYADQAIRELRDRMEAHELKVKNAAAVSGSPALSPTGSQQAAVARWTWPMPAAIGVAVLLIVLVAILK